MLSVVLYLFIFICSVCLFVALQKIKVGENFLLSREEGRPFQNILLFLLSMIPVILLYGFRFGIGADYFSYLEGYEVFHQTSIIDYFIQHTGGNRSFYQEPGFFLLNKIAPNFEILQILCIGLCLSVIFHVTFKYRARLRMEESIMIFLLLDFVYLMNGIRYVIALSFLLWAYSELAERKFIKFIALVLCAGLFHTTALLCLAFIVLVDFKNQRVNLIRNAVFIVGTALLPWLFPAVFSLLGMIPAFSRYVTTALYAPTQQLTYSGGLKWTMHFIPVFAPILLLRKRLDLPADIKTLNRIAYMEIPLRIIAMFNPWYGRLTRLTQIAQVIVIPCFLRKIENRKIRTLLTIYYAAWYVFYFIYYAVFLDGSSIPYVSIFSQ